MGCTSSNPAAAAGNSRPTSSTSSSSATIPRPPAALDALPPTLKARYKLGEQLGEGAFSIVRAGRSTIGDFKVAVKIVNRVNLPKEDEVALRGEVDILKQLKHPNIVQCFDFFEEDKSYNVILEFLEGGELFDRIVKKTAYNEKEARDLVYIILSALKYCHDRDVVHRDLKPENLLLASKSDDAQVKLADFGFAIKAKGTSSLKTQCGTPGYVAPEILEGKPYGKAVDMWSIGVITYVILGGYPPFYDDNQKVLYKKIKAAKYEFHPDYWSNISNEAKDLIAGLLTLEPEERLTATQALAHPWLKADPKSLASRNLDANLEEFRKYNTSRRLKGAVKAVMAVNKIKNLTNSLKAPAAAENEFFPDSPTGNPVADNQM